MPDPFLISSALAVAALVAAGTLLLFRLLLPAKHGVDRALGELLGIGAGVFVGCLMLGALPHWPPREDMDRLLLLLLPGLLLVEFLASLPKVSWWFAWLLRLPIVFGAARVLLYGSIFLNAANTETPSDWSTPTGGLLLAELAVVLVFVWALLAWRARGSSGSTICLALSMACVVAGATTMLSRYATGGVLGMPIAGALAGATVASLALPKAKPGHAVLSVGVVLLFSLLVIGYFFGELSMPHALVIFFSPLLCWLTASPPLRKLGSRMKDAVTILLVAIPLILVAGDVYRQHKAELQTAPGSEDEFEKDAAEMYK